MTKKIGETFKLAAVILLSIKALTLPALANEVDLPMSFTACPTGTLNQTPEWVGKKIPEFTKVILVPGAGAKGDVLWLGPIAWKEYFAEYLSKFKAEGLNAELHSVSSTGNEGLEKRVTDLIKRILSPQNNNEKILLIGHSMGGLTSRLALRDSRIWNRVVGAIQISAPNLGTELVEALFKKDENLPWITMLSKLIGFDIDDKEYIREMTYAHASRVFRNSLDQQANMPPIFSIVAGAENIDLARPIPLLAIGGKWIKEELVLHPERTGAWGTISDGVVPAYSQHWGECLGWFQGSHAQVLGKILTPRERTQFDAFMNRFVRILKNASR